MRKYINLIGVELEGSWERIHRMSPIQVDHSVRGSGNFRHSGEAVSPPLDETGVIAWISKHHPDAVNETCGFHIHVSLKKLRDYNRLTSERFYKLLLKRMGEWGIAAGIPPAHHFWQRLAGTFTIHTPAGNVRNFCRKEFLPERQLHQMGKGGNESARHCHLNFCYDLHGTMELRLLPAWDTLDRYVGSLKAFLQVIEEFLQAEDLRRENKLRIKLTPQVKPLRKLYSGTGVWF